MNAATYFARAVGEPFAPVKIGRSGYPPARVATIASKTKIKLEIIGLAPHWAESAFHQLLKDWHIGGEWFAASTALDKVVQQLSEGTFDFSSLPKGKRICAAGATYPTHIGKFSHLRHPMARAVAA